MHRYFRWKCTYECVNIAKIKTGKKVEKEEAPQAIYIDLYLWMYVCTYIFDVVYHELSYSVDVVTARKFNTKGKKSRAKNTI